MFIGKIKQRRLYVNERVWRNGGTILTKENGSSAKNLPPCRFVHHTPHMQ